jgi:predicted enzyme related to lactoylglutathione lyase
MLSIARLDRARSRTLPIDCSQPATAAIREKRGKLLNLIVSRHSGLEEAMAQPIVFFDIAGPDDKALKSFYSSVFGWEIDQAGQFGVPVASPIEAVIRKDPTEQRIYLGIPDVTASLSLIEQSGGTVDVPRFEVPGVVVLGLFRDPAGNPMGLVKMDGDSPRVP